MKDTVFNLRLKKSVSFLMIFVLIFSMAFGLSLSGSAAVKIKTLEKANNFFDGGAIRGIDVSKWQGGINWNKVAADDIKYAFIRASYGAEPDPYFVNNAQKAHENGIKVGAYHYARFKDADSMKKEAQFFLNQLEKVDITYPVVLDVENNHKLSKNELTELCIRFMNIIENKGYPVMLYSYQNFIDGHLNKAMLKDVNMWVANYKDHPSTIPHAIWQHTSYGKVAGIDGRVDINVCYNDLSIRKAIEVDPEVSKAVLTYLNETFGADMDVTGIDMDAIKYWTAAGIQADLAKFHDESVEVTGALCDDDLELLITLSGGDAHNAGILSCVQAKLFYTGNYTQNITGSFDTHMTEAITAYQIQKGIKPTGTLNKTTLTTLFDVQPEGEVLA